MIAFDSENYLHPVHFRFVWRGHNTEPRTELLALAGLVGQGVVSRFC